MRKYKLVILDLDDTLYNEIDYVMSGFRKVSQYIASLNLEPEEAIFGGLFQLFEEDANNVFDRFLAQQPALSDVEAIQLVEIYQSHMPDIHLTEETISVLSYLQNHGYILGLITDGRPVGQRNKIIALNLMQYISYYIITDELGGVEFRKPNTAAFHVMMDHFQVNAEEAIYIADNPTKDFYPCNQLGIDSVMVLNPQGVYQGVSISQGFEPQKTVENLRAIQELL